MFQDYDDGGIRAPSIETMSKSLKLAWISRFLINDQMCSESWKVIPNYYFDKYGGLKFLLHCNYDERFLKQANFPNFYKQILLYFSELKSSYNSESDQELILFNNKEIRIDGQTIFYQSWFSRNIILIQDLLTADGKILPYAEFIRKYELRCNFLTYMQVISVISLYSKIGTEKHIFRRIHS